VNVVTNSGTNQFHGTVFDFIRNNIINSTNFFSNAKDTLKRNQYGGTLGGYILKEKLFFFGGYQGTENRQLGNSTSYCVPTDAELAGDFSQMGGQCAAKSTTLINPVTNTVAVGRHIPTSYFSAPSLALIPYLADARARADQYGFVNVALPANYHEDQYIGRVDYTFSPRHNIFARYFLAQYTQPAYYSPTNLLLTTTAGNDERVQNVSLGDTFIFTPKLVNTFHATYARRRDNRGPTAGGINANKIGVNMYTYVPVDLRLTVTNGPSFGCGTCSPGFFNTQTEERFH
jgi:hypothetical protein